MRACSAQRRELRATITRGVCAVLCASSLSGCSQERGCLGGDDGSCIPESACEKVRFACPARNAWIRRIASSSERVAGSKALAAEGDIALGNDLISLVLDD